MSLSNNLSAVIPGARLELTPLPTDPVIALRLLNADYPQGELGPGQVQQIMNNPLYWVFCWASGLVLARWLLDNPAWVRGKRVLDFGCGSGVVAIAAALAGAREVVACDIDPDALMATAENAAFNRVDLQLTDDFYRVEGEVDLLLVADVLYDRGNLVWLEAFRERASQVLLADSRVKDFNAPGYRQLAARDAHTMPDLDESAEFRDVRIYLGAPSTASGASPVPT